MPSIEPFKKSLEKFNVDQSVISQINDGYEDISSKTQKKIRSAYFKRALDIMEEQLAPQFVHDIFESNACCKGGSRAKASKAFAKEFAGCSLDEKLEKIKSVPYMGSPIKNNDGTITVNAVSYYKDGKFACACPIFNTVKRDYSVSKNYCFCCAGHFKYHYEIMLGVKLKTIEIVSSPLDSDGRDACVIKYEIV